LRLLIVSGSKGKFFHLKEFADTLAKFGVESKVIKEIEYVTGFPTKNIRSWLASNKKFKKLIGDFLPDAVFIDRQSYFGLNAIKAKIPLFVLLRGHYWEEVEWAKKTIYKDPIMRSVVWIRNRVAEKCFRGATLILPICGYLENVVKEHYPQKTTHVFFEGIDASRWYHVKGEELAHPCVGLLQDANWWGKTKEMLILKKVLEAMPDVTFYWAGDGPYREKILSVLNKYKNFKWLGRLDYPDKVRKYLSEIDVYALVTGMDTAPLTLKEAQLMKKPVVATDVGGVAEMMLDHKTGFLIKEGDFKNWIDKLRLLLNDKKLSEEIGNNGHRFIQENFNWDVITKKFLNIVNSLEKN